MSYAREQGFSMPAEWQPHSAIWLAWPYDPTTFPDRVPKVEATYVQIVKEIHTSEDVNIFVIDEPTKKKAAKMFQEAGIDMGKVRIWVADYATYGSAITAQSLSRTQSMSWRLIHWTSTVWGDKYETLLKDKRYPDVINKCLKINVLKARYRVGGAASIDVNGEGTLFDTEQ
jgi:agmatine deiminase